MVNYFFSYVSLDSYQFNMVLEWNYFSVVQLYSRLIFCRIVQSFFFILSTRLILHSFFTIFELIIFDAIIHDPGFSNEGFSMKIKVTVKFIKTGCASKIFYKAQNKNASAPCWVLQLN